MRSSSYTRATLLLPLLMTPACANFTTQSDSGKSPYFDAAFDDRNRAPASFAPAVLAADGVATLDPLHMRTQADYHFAMGEAYSLEGNSEKAVEAFKTTLIYDQETTTVHMRLAAEYLKQGLLNEALVQAQQAVKKDPKHVDAHLLVGGLYSSMKAYAKAHDAYAKVMQLDPKNLDAPLYIGALYSEQKKSDKAVQYFEMLAKNSDYNSPQLAHYYIGRVRLDQGSKFDKEAIAAFQKAIDIKPDFVDAVISLGVVYNRQGQEDKALNLYVKYQKEHTPNSKVADILAQLYIEKNNYAKAFEQLEVVEADTDDRLNVRMKMALILIEQKHYDMAAQKLEEILLDAPDSDKVRFYLAAVYEESEQFEKARKSYVLIPPASAYYGEAVVHAAYILKNQGRLNEALEITRAGLKHRQDQPQVYAIYASLLDEKGDLKEALKVLEEGSAKFEKNTQLKFYYGTLQDRVGDKEKVIKAMEEVLAIEPNHVQGLNYLAYTWAEMDNKLADAEALARKAVELEPKDGYVLDTLGWILYKQHKNKEAIQFLEAAHMYQSGVSIIAEHLGDAYYKQAMIKKAKSMYIKAIALESDKKKIQEITQKLTALENQQLITPRLPASEGPIAGTDTAK